MHCSLRERISLKKKNVNQVQKCSKNRQLDIFVPEKSFFDCILDPDHMRKRMKETLLHSFTYISNNISTHDIRQNTPLIISISLTEPPQSTPHCPRLYGIFPDEAKCDVFWNCWGGEASRYQCSPGLAYDRDSRVCMWADQVPECKVDGKPLTKNPPILQFPLFITPLSFYSAQKLPTDSIAQLPEKSPLPELSPDTLIQTTAVNITFAWKVPLGNTDVQLVQFSKSAIPMVPVTAKIPKMYQAGKLTHFPF